MNLVAIQENVIFIIETFYIYFESHYYLVIVSSYTDYYSIENIGNQQKNPNLFKKMLIFYKTYAYNKEVRWHKGEKNMPRKFKTAKEEQVAIKIAENIKKIMKEKKLRQTDLSATTGIARSTMSDYVNGRTNIPMVALQKISEALGLTKSNLLEGDSEFIKTQEIEKLPIYGQVRCGNGLLTLRDIKGYLDTPSSWIQGGEHFYLLAEGDSMINVGIVDGSLLLIRRQAVIENGEIAAVMVNDEAMLKRLYRDGTTIKLISENPNHEDIILDERKDVVSIIGKLKKNIGEH